MSDSEIAFIRQYVSAFLGARAAMNYDEWCYLDQHSKMTTDQPIDDAVYQARETFKLLTATIAHEQIMEQLRGES